MTVIPDETSIDRSLHRLVAEDSPDLHTITTVDGVYRYRVPGDLCPVRLGAGRARRAPPGLVHAPRRCRARGADAPGRTQGPQRSADQCVPFPLRGRRLPMDRGSCRGWSTTGPEPLVVSAIRDIGDRKKSELDLELKASTDPLTGVANRTVFMDRLRHALRRLERRDTLVAVLFLDLDRFKLINDSVGHLIGDAVLMKMAERLRAFLRPQDTLARWGGDEFAVVIEDLSWPEEAVVLGERIIEAGTGPVRRG